jgi:hypothetical protein
MDADQFSAAGAEGRFKRALVLLFVLIGSTGTISSAADYAIAHDTVINPGRAKPRRDMTIVVHEDAIVAVLPSKQFRPKSSVKIIEKRGKFVLPGLWDMHVHFRDASRDLKMDIANGVLCTRNMGGDPKDVFSSPGRDRRGYADRTEDRCLRFDCGWSGLVVESTIHSFSKDCRRGPSCRGIPEKTGERLHPGL